MTDAAALGRHYAVHDLEPRIRAALAEAGKDPAALRPADLAAVDQFHTGGRQATIALARLANVRAGMRVLDVGGGLGGAARTLAAEFACHVCVVDLTEAYCRAGAALTRWTGLADRVQFHHASALDLPFAAGAFDVAWTQHSTMNVADKVTLARELHRVLRPGGRLAMHEVLAGVAGPPHFPVPWAREAVLSFLEAPEAARARLAAAGFVEVTWQDTSEAALAWFTQRLAPAAAAAAPAPLGLHLLLGPETGRMLRNMKRNLEEQRIRVVEAILDRG